MGEDITECYTHKKGGPMVVRNEAPHFCAGVVFRKHPEYLDRDQVLVINYTETHHGRNCRQIKLPGGCAKPGESPEETFLREFEAEVGCRPSTYVREPIWEDEVKAGQHTRYFFWAQLDSLATMRVDETLDGKDFLSPPYWLEVGVALSTLFYSHRQALEEVVSILEARLALP